MKFVTTLSVLLLIETIRVDAANVGVKKLESSIKPLQSTVDVDSPEPDACCFAPAPVTLWTCTCTYEYQSTYDSAPWTVGETIPNYACSGAPTTSQTNAINKCIQFYNTYGRCNINLPIPCTSQQG